MSPGPLYIGVRTLIDPNLSMTDMPLVMTLKTDVRHQITGTISPQQLGARFRCRLRQIGTLPGRARACLPLSSLALAPAWLSVDPGISHQTALRSP